MPTAKPTPGKLLPPLPPAMPDWSPVRTFGGYQKRADTSRTKIRFALLHTSYPQCPTCPGRPRLLVLGGVT